ncbi:hypothetical protein TI03_02695 [Achromatium sp. WMS1]|nr:hypothetical protein TI03_02695 [Achromatium sp. WMS1]
MRVHDAYCFDKTLFKLLIWVAAIIIASPVSAEITFPHPELGSIVFTSPHTQQTGIQPAEPIFVHPSSPTSSKPITAAVPQPTIQNWWWSHVPSGSYHNNQSDTVNVSPYPSNQDVTSYNIQRAHNFSQNLYRNNDAHRDNAATYPYWFYYGGGAFGGLSYPANYPPYYPYSGYPYPGSGYYFPYYPPPRPTDGNGINQSSMPSNSDVTSYNIDRAHRFSADGYKAP